MLCTGAITILHSSHVVGEYFIFVMTQIPWFQFLMLMCLSQESITTMLLIIRGPNKLEPSPIIGNNHKIIFRNHVKYISIKYLHVPPTASQRRASFLFDLPTLGNEYQLIKNYHHVLYINPIVELNILVKLEYGVVNVPMYATPILCGPDYNQLLCTVFQF